MQGYMSDTKKFNFEDLKNLTIAEFKVINDNKEIRLKTKCGKHVEMSHIQDCCEDVYIDEIIGDIEDILNFPILAAEVVTNEENPKKKEPDDWGSDSFTWTFYKLMTIKGNLTIRWYGESNGYYSEEVACFLLDE